MVMSNRRQKGQDLIEYALLLALVVAVGIYVYVHGGLTDSLKQIYGSASSVVDIINGEHGGEGPGITRQNTRKISIMGKYWRTP